MSLFSTTLLDWYDKNKRDLPWRQTTDPYKIWLSEIILQQTRVVQGSAYYERFLCRFPSLQSLAEASEDEVLKYWQGLGYYSRARNLLIAARSMNGVFPTTYDQVRSLKGVGDYTAAAICSFAYRMPHAVVDGNVYRVLARYFDIEVPIDSTLGKRTFKAMAEEMLDTSRPDIYNQAIMDFGALQCVPQNPDCNNCPFRDNCMAHKKNTVSSLPFKQNKTKVRERFFNYFFISNNDYFYIHKRDDNDIWKGMYQLPLIETSLQLSTAALIEMPVYLQWKDKFEGSDLIVCQYGMKHILSHQILYINLYELSIKGEMPIFDNYIKIHKDEIDRYALPRPIEVFIEKKLHRLG